MNWIMILWLTWAPAILAPVDLGALAIAEAGRSPAPGHNSWQITAPALEDYNVLRGGNFTMEDMLQPQKCEAVADWYINKVLTRYLLHYKIPRTTENYLIAWHDGIGNLIKYRKGQRVLGKNMQGLIKRYYIAHKARQEEVPALKMLQIMLLVL